MKSTDNSFDKHRRRRNCCGGIRLFAEDCCGNLGGRAHCSLRSRLARCQGQPKEKRWLPLGAGCAEGRQPSRGLAGKTPPAYSSIDERSVSPRQDDLECYLHARGVGGTITMGQILCGDWMRQGTHSHLPPRLRICTLGSNGRSDGGYRQHSWRLPAKDHGRPRPRHRRTSMH